MGSRKRDHDMHALIFGDDSCNSPLQRVKIYFYDLIRPPKKSIGYTVIDSKDDGKRALSFHCEVKTDLAESIHGEFSNWY